MKKIILVIVLGMAIIFANAQVSKTTTTSTLKTTKATVTKTNNTTQQVAMKGSASAVSNKTKLSTDQFPKAITDEITKNYPGYKISDAYKLDNKGVISYELMVIKAKSQMNLFYDKDYKFIKKELPFTKTTVATKVKAAAKK